MSDSEVSKHMNLHEFINGVIRLAAIKFPVGSSAGLAGIAARLQLLVDHHIKPLACYAHDSDTIARVLQTDPVQQTFSKHKEKLFHEFSFLKVDTHTKTH